MTEFKAPHTGLLSGDARVSGRTPRVSLRETKAYWISRDGTKFRKTTGWPTGGDSWPLWTLALETIKPIAPPDLTSGEKLV